MSLYRLLSGSLSNSVISGLQNIPVEDLEENVRNHSVAYLLVYPASDSLILVYILTYLCRNSPKV